MGRIVCFALMMVVVMVVGCGGRKHDAAYYEGKIDSIRKAEQLEQLRKMKAEAGIYDDPVEQFFDTLHIRPLPIRSAGGNIGRLAHFASVPKSLASLLGYPVETPLKIVALPKSHGHRVVMLAEERDSIAPMLSLMTLNKVYEPIDELTIYEQKVEERGEEIGLAFNEYYITSKYEITLLFAFIRQDSKSPTLESTRRYVINDDGFFEEVVVDL